MDAQETSVYHALLIAGFIFFLVFIVFVITIFNYQKRSTLAYLAKMGASLRVVETEKSRMAADVHDEIGSRFSTIRALMDRILSAKGADDTLAGTVQSIFSALSASIRHISNSMVPYALHREGLEIALQELIAMMFPGASMLVVMEYRVDTRILDEEMALHIYRMIQELLTNILKHAKATEIRISLQQHTTLRLLLNDNGTGFDKKLVKRSSGGIGLRNVSARVQTLKGTMYLTTAPGKGTEYRIELPFR